MVFLGAEADESAAVRASRRLSISGPVPRSMAPKQTIVNPSLVALLKRWTTAAEQAGHSSSQAGTFRKACKSVAIHPTPLTSKAELLQVKYVGETIASALADHLAFERARRGQALLRVVAHLRHPQEGKWWTVRVCANMAWRSWGKCSDSGAEQPGLDNYEHCHGGEPEALAWAVGKAAKQLKKGYAHVATSEADYAAAKRDMAQPAPRARAGGGARATAGNNTAAQAAALAALAAADDDDDDADDAAALAERLRRDALQQMPRPLPPPPQPQTRTRRMRTQQQTTVPQLIRTQTELLLRRESPKSGARTSQSSSTHVERSPPPRPFSSPCTAKAHAAAMAMSS